VSFDPATVRLLPETLARRYRALILQADASGLLVGMADPTRHGGYATTLAARLNSVAVALIESTY